MEFILYLKGNVAHPLTIDPSVWIFDERKILVSDIGRLNGLEDADTLYLKDVSSHWDREITKGAELPSDKAKESGMTKKEYLLQNSFAMPLAPFIKNAEPAERARAVIIQGKDQTETISLDDAARCYLAFSENGKPLKEDGPIHVYFPDSSKPPMKHIIGFEIV
ncbi:peptidyl-prolyl cis-trans isomerase [Fictibacillus iocasae]|uniref:Peptidyl-prolyl cis-trans isomerase n=1 Tax=Fictibacillus iocasae TaxID=2715437 RepID=A0ABW2NTR7_9BACL